MCNFIIGLIAGGCVGLVLAALLGAAGKDREEQALLEAYRAGYNIALEQFRRYQCTGGQAHLEDA